MLQRVPVLRHFFIGISCLLGACDPFQTQFDDEEDAIVYDAIKLSSSTLSVPLRVMTYNIKFAGGRVDFFFDCHDDDVLMTNDVVLAHLEALAELINKADPDVLFLQEVDVLSKRSAYIDQVQWLLDHTKLNHGVYASQWKAAQVPSDGIGAVDSGNAILSKAHLKNGKRLALPLRSDQSSIEQYFYLKRNILIADLDNTESIRLLVTHTAAYSQDGTKAEQLSLFEEEMARAPSLLIAAGDLNAIPPDSDKVRDFDDSVCIDENFQADDFSDETDVLRKFYDNYSSAIPLDDYQSNNKKHFTHTTDKDGFWNRKLDYIFTNASIVVGSGVTHQDDISLGIETMPLSDHAPLTVEIELR